MLKGVPERPMPKRPEFSRPDVGRDVDQPGLGGMFPPGTVMKLEALRAAVAITVAMAPSPDRDVMDLADEIYHWLKPGKPKETSDGEKLDRGSNQASGSAAQEPGSAGGTENSGLEALTSRSL